MNFSHPLTKGKLIKRYKRFLADVELKTGEVVTAHCANTGAMLGLNMEGVTVYLSANENPKAKLAWRWEAVGLEDGTIVGINTSHPNRLVEAAILTDKVPELAGYANLKREVKYGANSRIDLLLSDGMKGLCYVEVKNVHLLREKGLAEFPDSVTARGAKHLFEMAEMIKQGHRAVMVYLIQRDDCSRFKIASDIDPAYALALTKAMENGVEAIALKCKVSEEGIDVIGKVEITL